LSYTNGIGTPQQLPGVAEAAASSSASRTAKTEAVSGQNGFNNGVPVDQANVSSTASAVAQGLSGSDVRNDKVVALQQSIAAGTYSVSASDVAGKVMSALLK
jgi:negative regulator of flagellin synthesis FlgM